MSRPGAFLSGVILLSLLFGGSSFAGEARAEIRGSDPRSAIRYLGSWEGETLQRFRLQRGDLALGIRLGVAPGPRQFRIESLRDSASGAIRLSATEQDALRDFLGTLRPARSPLENGLARVVNLLASWPPDLPVLASLRAGVLETSLGRWQTEGSSDGIGDICARMNRLHSGSYPVNLIPRGFESIVGPYPWADGGCLGRCGAGCVGDGPPNNSVWVYGQDCFDHDACVRDQGLTDLDCNLIFPAAFDDFLYGPSCQKDNADLTIQGQDGPVDLAPGVPVDIRVSLINVPTGTPVEYWVYAETSAGPFWLDSAGVWQTGAPVPTRTGPLVQVSDRPIYQGLLPPGFPPGPAFFYVSVDLVPDGIFGDRQFEDAVQVRVLN